MSPEPRVPDFFIVGHHKSGTTALYEMLRRHPQIFMPDLKEPRWFASDLKALTKPPPHSPLPKTYEEYLALFCPAREDQIIGEASPSYLRSEQRPAKIAEVQPKARHHRDPARARELRQVAAPAAPAGTRRDREGHAARLRGRGDRANGRPVLRYSDHIHYVEQLRRYEALFPPEQILVLIYDASGVTTRRPSGAC